VILVAVALFFGDDRANLLGGKQQRASSTINQRHRSQ